MLTIEVFVLIDEIGVEEPVVVKVIDTHVGGEANHEATKVGSITLGLEAVDLVADLRRKTSLLGIIESEGALKLRLKTVEKLDTALFAVVVHN
jgi:hypothetical protein